MVVMMEDLGKFSISIITSLSETRYKITIFYNNCVTVLSELPTRLEDTRTYIHAHTLRPLRNTINPFFMVRWLAAAVSTRFYHVSISVPFICGFHKSVSHFSRWYHAQSYVSILFGFYSVFSTLIDKQVWLLYIYGCFVDITK